MNSGLGELSSSRFHHWATSGAPGSLGTLMPSFTTSWSHRGMNAKAAPPTEVLLLRSPKASSHLPLQEWCYLLAGVSRSDQSTGGSWMRNWSCTQKAIPSLPVASGICQTPTPLKCLEPLPWWPFKMKCYQISLHSHLPLNLMNVTRWQAMPGKASSRQFKKKEQLYLSLFYTQ